MTTALTVTHLSITDWVIIAVCSGFAAAIFNQIAGGLLAKFQRSSDQRHQQALQESEQKFQERMQKDAREHESLQLLIKSHFEQRDKLLEAATESYNWIYYQLFRNYGFDHEVYEYNEPDPKFKDVSEVVGGLRLIAQAHPTRSVRRLASELKNDISAHYSSLTEYGEHDEPIVGGPPSEDQLFSWLKKCDALIELMHTPPSLDEVRGSSDRTLSASDTASASTASASLPSST
jgi:hypothetical protein